MSLPLRLPKLLPGAGRACCARVTPPRRHPPGLDLDLSQAQPLTTAPRHRPELRLEALRSALQTTVCSTRAPRALRCWGPSRPHLQLGRWTRPVTPQCLRRTSTTPKRFWNRRTIRKRSQSAASCTKCWMVPEPVQATTPPGFPPTASHPKLLGLGANLKVWANGQPVASRHKNASRTERKSVK